MSQIKTAILGASGYTGAELIRLLANHPRVSLDVLTANRYAGQTIGAVFPHLGVLNLPILTKIEDTDWSKIELVFCALPHGTTQEIVRDLPKHLKVIDLSADFRLIDSKTYEEWYGHPHLAMERQKEAVYGLAEWSRDAIKKTNLVAVPGCYPTCSMLPLIPLLKEKAIDPELIIIDAKSGTSGAGRAAKEETLFTEVSEGFRPYGIGKHRHMAEMEQTLAQMAGTEIRLSFTPHLIPINRGMLATISITPNKGFDLAKIRTILEKTYKSEHFVRVLPAGQVPDVRHTRSTNFCLMNVFADRHPKRLIITSVLDNLCKGASGQAIQCMNIMLGFDEKLGLEGLPLFP